MCLRWRGVLTVPVCRPPQMCPVSPGNSLTGSGGDPGLVPPSVLRGGGRWAEHRGFSHPALPPRPSFAGSVLQREREGGVSPFRSPDRRFWTRSRLDCSPSSGSPPQDQNRSRHGSRNRCQVGAVLGNGQTPVNAPSCRTDAPRDSNLEGEASGAW
ncbi:hypothetical protein OJAV_G00049530 [Oryzias javanicus]|uniref:Uncharacterized protein n=1 Tax=Oryzias javanicus TaxID=123683 RepID=A0A3S2MDJ4_ORYJA|nr:hypothetical protein OJAV_G00049530 [Oryzias javanicus]